MDAGHPDQTRAPSRYREFRLRVPWGLGTPVQPTAAGRRTTASRGNTVGRRPAVDNSVTITEAARRLGVSTKTIRRRIADGSLAAHKAQGPGGFQYRVTDPSVLVVTAGLDGRLDTRDAASKRAGQEVGQTLGRTLLELTGRVAAAEVRAARAEWERDALRAEVEGLRRVLPGPVVLNDTDVTPARRRWWWPFPAR